MSGFNIIKFDGSGGGGGGTGDVDGPGSSTDNAVVRFDGTTGKIIKDSPVTLSDGAVFLAGPDLSGQSITIQSADGDGYYTSTGNVEINTGTAFNATINLRAANVNTSDALTTAGTLTVNGSNALISNILNVNGITNLNDDLIVTGTSNLQDAVTISSDAVSVVNTGSATIDWDAIINFTETPTGTLAVNPSSGQDGVAVGSYVISGDFFAEYTIGPIPDAETSFGFSQSITRFNGNIFNDGMLFNYALDDANTWIVESGNTQTMHPVVVPGDVIRVEYLGGQVLYKLNGGIVHTSALAPVYPVYVVARFHGSASPQTAHITNAQQTTYEEQAVNLTEWQNASGTTIAAVQSDGLISGSLLSIHNITENGDVVTSTIQGADVVQGTQDIDWQNLLDFTQGPTGTLFADPSFVNRFALGNVVIESGDFFAETTVGAAENGIAFGFSADNTNPGGGPFGGNLAFGYRLDAGTNFDIGIYEGASTPVEAYGTVGGKLPEVNSGDTIRIEYSGGRVFYKVNGNIIYISANAPIYPAYVKFIYGGTSGVTIISGSQQTIYTEQTADLTQWKNSDGDVVAAVNATGISTTIPIFVDATNSDFISFDTSSNSSNTSPAIRVQSVGMGPTTTFTVSNQGIVALAEITDLSVGDGLIVHTISGASTGGINISSGNATSGTNSGAITEFTGDVTGAGVSGGINAYTGSAVTGFSGGFDSSTGDVTSGSSGGHILYTGSASTGAGTSGYIQLETGVTQGSGNTGVVNLITGGALGSGGSGAINLTTGDSASGIFASGIIKLETGAANTPNSTGYVNIITGDNAGSGGTGQINLITGVNSGSTGTGSITVTTGIPGGTSGGSGTVSIYSGSAEDGGSGDIGLFSGSTTGSGLTGGVNLSSGSADGTGDSGAASLGTGTSAAGSTGENALYTGDVTTGSGTTGVLVVSTGTANSGDSGDLSVFTGNTDTGALTGNLSITTGNSVNGDSSTGNISLSTGTLGANGNNGQTGNISLITGVVGAGGDAPSGQIIISTGDCSPGTGDSGPITLTTGVTSGGIRGSVQVVAKDLSILTVGAGLTIAEGSNAKMGVSTLVTGTVTVSTTAVTANSRIMLTGQNSSGTHGELTVSARTANTSFVITSNSALDTRSVAWIIFEPS